MLKIIDILGSSVLSAVHGLLLLESIAFIAVIVVSLSIEKVRGY